MRGWQEVPLQSVASIDRSAVSASGISADTRYVGMEHVDEDGDVEAAPTVAPGDLRSTKFRFSPKHLLYGKLRPYLRKIARPSLVGVCSTDILPILPGERVDRDYLFHCLRWQPLVDLVNAQTTGANLPRISPTKLGALRIPLPPLPEQRRIATILDKADAIRRKRQESLALLDALLRSTFLQMFGDPVRNERGWEVVRLGEVAEDLRYGTSTKCQTTPSPGSFPVLRIPNVVGGAVSLDDLKYARLPAGQVEPVRLRKGDILFVRTNGNPGYIGRCAVFNEDLPALFASYLIRARIKGRKGCLPEFLVGMMSLPSFRARFVAETRTTAGNYNLSASGLRSLELIMPPIDLQHRYLAVTEKVKGEQDRQSEHLDLATHLFHSLSQRAFQGELPG